MDDDLLNSVEIDQFSLRWYEHQQILSTTARFQNKPINQSSHSLFIYFVNKVPGELDEKSHLRSWLSRKCWANSWSKVGVFITAFLPQTSCLLLFSCLSSHWMSA